MQLCYFDENKHSADNPNFWIGGLFIPENHAIEFESTLSDIAFNFFNSRTMTVHSELHAKDLFHGKGNAKKRALSERIKVFQEVSQFICDNQIPVRMVKIDVDRHKSHYAHPMPEYHLGLMLMLESFAKYLDKHGEIGLVFGDYESDEMTKAVVDFSEYKSDGKTPMYFGRPLGRIIDTVYFTQSHHNRFLQVADLLVYMAGRYEGKTEIADKWHEKEVQSYWQKIKASTDFVIKHWP
jgi:hypothetical protein